MLCVVSLSVFHSKFYASLFLRVIFKLSNRIKIQVFKDLKRLMWTQLSTSGTFDFYFLPLVLGFLLAALVKWLVCAPRFIVTSKVDEVSSNFILISGCDTGFGRALTLRLLNEGLNVIAGCFTEKVCC